MQLSKSKDQSRTSFEENNVELDENGELIEVNKSPLKNISDQKVVAVINPK